MTIAHQYKQTASGYGIFNQKIKELFAHVRLLLWIVLCIFLIFGSNHFQSAFQPIRTLLLRVASPFFELAQMPAKMIALTHHEILHFYSLKKDLHLFDEQKKTLENLALENIKLQDENRELSRLLKKTPENWGKDFITARIIGNPSGSFAKSILINAGTFDGVTKNDVAVCEFGIVGIVVEANRKTSRVLLVNDINARVAVRLPHTEIQAIASGSGSDFLNLDYLTTPQIISEGAPIYTSGYGNIFPPGIFVGYAHHHENNVVINLPKDYTRLQFVKILLLSSNQENE